MSNILNIEIRPVDDALEKFGSALSKLERGETVEPHFSIGFETVPQFAKVFTAKRWELITVLKKLGAVSIYELAKQLDRHYRNVHQDVALLSEWLVIEKDESGKIMIPWDEIDVRMPLSAVA